MNKTIEKIKRANASISFFIAALAFTLGPIVFLFAATTLPSALYKTVTAMVNEESAMQAMNTILLPSFNAMPFSLLADSVLALVMAAGMWMHFASSRKNSDQISTLGLGIIRLVTVIRAIVFALGLLLVAVVAFSLSVALFAILEAAGQGNYIYAFLAVLGGLFLVVLIAVIFYYRGILRTIKSIRMTLSTGVIMGKVSGYVIVVNYILALVFLVAAIATTVVTAMIAGLLTAAGFIFLSVAMGHLKSEMAYIAARGGDSIS